MAVSDSAMVRPASEHRTDCTPKLNMTVLRELLTQLILYQLLVERDDMLPFNGAEVGIIFVAEAAFSSSRISSNIS